jgi:hypothetical protein
VIRMEVGDEQIVDPRHSGTARRGSNARRITGAAWIARSRLERARAGKPGVDEERLALRGDDEGRLPALDVDEVDVERVSGLRAQRNRRDKNGADDSRGETLQAGPRLSAPPATPATSSFRDRATRPYTDRAGNSV